MDPLEASVRSGPVLSAAASRKPREASAALPGGSGPPPAGGPAQLEAAAGARARDAARGSEAGDRGEGGPERLSRSELARAQQEQRAQLSRPEPHAGAGPVIAVRVGVPPVEQAAERVSAKSALEAALRERAALRDVGDVLSLPPRERGEVDAREEAADAARSAAGESRAVDTEREPVVLPGSGDSDPERSLRRPELAAPQVRPERVGRFDARDPRASRPAPEPASPVEGREIAVRERHAPEARAESERLQEAVSATGGSGTGAVRDPNEAQRPLPPPLLGSGEGNPELQAAVERVTTQFSRAVEARRSDELVSRFLANLPRSEPGPAPRFREPVTA